MKAIPVLLVVLFAASAASAEDAWTRLRNASANELCWDTARGIAREKYPSGDAMLTEISFKRPPPTGVKDGRKAFPGIRTCCFFRVANGRHARACPGHPRSCGHHSWQDVDGRDKPGHDSVLPNGYARP